MIAFDQMLAADGFPQGEAHPLCLMYLSTGLAVDMCDPHSYVDEDCPTCGRWTCCPTIWCTNPPPAA